MATPDPFKFPSDALRKELADHLKKRMVNKLTREELGLTAWQNLTKASSLEESLETDGKIELIKNKKLTLPKKLKAKLIEELIAADKKAKSESEKGNKKGSNLITAELDSGFHYIHQKIFDRVKGTTFTEKELRKMPFPTKTEYIDNLSKCVYDRDLNFRKKRRQNPPDHPWVAPSLRKQPPDADASKRLSQSFTAVSTASSALSQSSASSPAASSSAVPLTRAHDSKVADDKKQVNDRALGATSGIIAATPLKDMVPALQKSLDDLKLKMDINPKEPKENQIVTVSNKAGTRMFEMVEVNIDGKKGTEFHLGPDIEIDAAKASLLACKKAQLDSVSPAVIKQYMQAAIDLKGQVTLEFTPQTLNAIKSISANDKDFKLLADQVLPPAPKSSSLRSA